MTGPDYYNIAGALAKCAGGIGQDNLYYVADMIAVDLQRADPTFKYELFLKEAGVEDATITRAQE